MLSTLITTFRLLALFLHGYVQMLSLLNPGTRLMAWFSTWRGVLYPALWRGVPATAFVSGTVCGQSPWGCTAVVGLLVVIGALLCLQVTRFWALLSWRVFTPDGGLPPDVPVDPWVRWPMQAATEEFGWLTVRSFAGWVWRLVWPWGPRLVLDEVGEEQAKDWLENLDDLVDVGPEFAAGNHRARRGYVGRVARRIKADGGLGTPKYTEANILVVRRKAADIMEEHGVRPSHIAALLPMTVALVFTPLPEEIEAARFMASAAAAERRRAVGTWWRASPTGLVRGPVPEKS